jgi:diguanylate cyclase (GGDEF)-like protein/PAS domain S-box-containing protein
MDKELRILILEDNPADAELEEHELRKARLVFTSNVVDTKEAFLKALDEFFPDIILSDYDLPSFDGLAALRIAKGKCPDVPFILVTGKLGEEFAIEKLKEGATDYVLKSNLKRLVPSVNRALEEAKLIVERKRAEEALRESQLIIEGIINAIPVRVFWKDKNLVYLGCNAIFARDAGFKDPKDVIGKDDYQMVWRDQAELYRGDDRQVIESRSPKILIEEPQMTPDGNIITLLTSKVPLRSSGGEIVGVLGTYMDITERKLMEEELKRLSVTDNLTQTYNRTKHEEIIKRETERTKRYLSPLSISMFDIDHFKKVNDTFGHNVGDYVLKTIAQIVKNSLRELDYLVRWGGEEFLIIAPDTDIKGAEVMAERIRKLIESYKFDKVDKVTLSFGVTQFKDEDTEDNFIKRADDAMYRAKEKGRNRVEVTA